MDHIAPSIFRVGVIGTSPFCDRMVLQPLSNHPSARITAICGRNRVRDEELAAKYHIPHIFTDYREMVRSPEVDGVAVISPNNLHHPMSMAALEAGKHVFCEKPLGMDLREALEMHRKAKETGLIALVNFTWRGIPAAMYMNDLVKEGYIGKPYHIMVSFIMPLHVTDVWMWRREQAQAGYGALGDLGSHCVDMARWMCGDVSRVSAHLATLFPQLRQQDGTVVPNKTDDTCALLLEFESGAQGIVHASWSAHPGLGGGWTRVELHGSKGMLALDINRILNPRSWITLLGSGADGRPAAPLPLPREYTEGIDVTTEDAVVRTVSHKPWYTSQRFVEAVVRRREPSPSFYDGMKVQAILDAAAESHRSGRWVGVPTGE